MYFCGFCLVQSESLEISAPTCSPRESQAFSALPGLQWPLFQFSWATLAAERIRAKGGPAKCRDFFRAERMSEVPHICGFVTWKCRLSETSAPGLYNLEEAPENELTELPSTSGVLLPEAPTEGRTTSSDSSFCCGRNHILKEEMCPGWVWSGFLPCPQRRRLDLMHGWAFSGFHRRNLFMYVVTSTLKYLPIYCPN